MKVNWHFQWDVQRKGFAPNACVMILALVASLMLIEI